MLSWIKYWFSKPEPIPKPVATIEVHPRNLYPHTRYTMSPPRILEWCKGTSPYRRGLTETVPDPQGKQCDHNPNEKKEEV